MRAQQAVLGTSVEISRESGPNSVSLGRSRFIADERRWPHLLWPRAGSFSSLRPLYKARLPTVTPLTACSGILPACL